MKRIAPDVERLMWMVAEGRDPKAIADFENRFPDLRYELSKRISMVSQLRSAGRSLPTQAIPRFVPSYASARPARAKGMYVVLAAVLGALAFGSYAAVSLMNPSRPRPIQPPEAVRQDRPQSPYAGVRFRTTPPSLVPREAPSEPSQQPPIAENPAPPADPLDRLVTLKGDGVPLQSVIDMLCRQAQLKCEITPGLPNPELADVDYPGVPAGQVLADLGQKNGFTAIPQEKGTILIIPARAAGSQGTGGWDGAGSTESDPSKPSPIIRGQ